MGIACSIYDELELAAVKQWPVELVFTKPADETKTVSGVVVNFYVKEGCEFVVFQDGQVEQLDHLVEFKIHKK